MNAYYYKARMYSPKTGRFLQPDPIGYSDGMTKSPGAILNRLQAGPEGVRPRIGPNNLYGYVGGDPVNSIDPSGLAGSILEQLGEVVVNGWRNVPIPWCDQLCQAQIIGDFSAWIRGQDANAAQAGPMGGPSGDGGAGGGAGHGEARGKCWNASAGIGGALHGPVAGPVGVGVSGGLNFLGFSYGGSMLDSRLFVQVQAAAMAGTGIYGGVGIQVQGGLGAIGPGVNSTESWHGEASAGFLGGISAGADYAGDGRFSSAGGYHGKLPLGRYGAGVGLSAGVGVSTTSTIGSASIREALNRMSNATGWKLPGSGSSVRCD